MLNKNEVINGLKNEEFIAAEAVYDYVCKLHLYDDEDICKEFISL